jgi:hypothetical protein
MRKFTGPGAFPATHRICITQVTSVLPSSTGSAQVKFTNNYRSTSILIFSYIGLVPQENTRGRRTTLCVKAPFAGAINYPLIVINTLPKSQGASGAIGTGNQADLENRTPLLR